MVYHFRVHEEDNGYWAECVELAGCITEADSLDWLAANAEEALNLYLDEPETFAVIFPLPESHAGAIHGANIAWRTSSKSPNDDSSRVPSCLTNRPRSTVRS